jgi:hypothetical protein
MLDVICAIDLLLLHLTNVIHVLISNDNTSTLFILFSICATFYFDTPALYTHIYAHTHTIQTSHTCSKLIDLYIDV